MNEIVREHYSVRDLPEDLRAYFDPDKPVTLVVEQDAEPVPGPLTRFGDRRLTSAGVTSDEAVARIRALRDEWDD